MQRKPLTILWIVILVLSAGFGSSVKGDGINKDRAEAGFTQIFNGKDLTGWDGDPAFWSVKDGRIIAQVSPGVRVKNHTYLIWQGPKLRDFELQVMLRSSQGNSGIDYRAEPVHKDKDGQDLKWTIRGYQSDIAKGWMGSLYNWGKPGAQPSQFVVVTGKENVTKYIGSIADKDALLKAGYYKPEDWNEFTIIARGSHILHRINGYLVAEFIDNSRDTRKEGVFGLQVHSGRGPFLNEFKDIRIKQLNVNFGQAKPLFIDEDFRGWLFSSPEAKNSWSVRARASQEGREMEALTDGVLVNKGESQGKGTSYICTKNDYANYVLRFQYRRFGKRKGGVLLRLTGQAHPHPKGIRIYGKGDDFNRVRGIVNFALKAPRKRVAAFRRMPEGLWNECEIVLNKGQLEVKVNGVLRAIATDCEQTAGKIGFEASGSRVEYRNIVLVPILNDSTK